MDGNSNKTFELKISGSGVDETVFYTMQTHSVRR